MLMEEKKASKMWISPLKFLAWVEHFSNPFTVYYFPTLSFELQLQWLWNALWCGLKALKNHYTTNLSQKPSETLISLAFSSVAICFFFFFLFFFTLTCYERPSSYTTGTQNPTRTDTVGKSYSQAPHRYLMLSMGRMKHGSHAALHTAKRMSWLMHLKLVLLTHLISH